MNKTFEIEATWSHDILTPAQVGARFLKMIELLEPLSTAMRNWLVLDGPDFEYVPLSAVSGSMTKLVENSLQWKYPDGPDDPDYGYTVIAKGSRIPSDVGAADATTISINAGGLVDNHIRFEVGGLQYPTDTSIVTYPIYRASLEALASAWPCPWALAYAYDHETPPADDPHRGLMRRTFEVAWIAYLSAPLAAGLRPSPDLTAEPTPGGGLILSAVRTLIDQANVDDMRRSRLLESVLIERVGISKQYGPQPEDHPARVGPY